MVLRATCVSLEAEVVARLRERVLVVAMICVVVLCWFLSHQISIYCIRDLKRKLDEKGVFIC